MAVPSSERSAVKQLAEAVKAITALGEKLDIAIFGRWDKDENREIPGLIRNVKTINERLDAREKRDRWLWGGIFLIACLGTSGQYGLLPAKEIGQSIAQNFWQYVVSHPATPP